MEILKKENIDRKKSLLRDEVKKLENLKIVLRNEFNNLNFQQKILESKKVIFAENVENKIENEIKNNDGLISLNIFLRLINNKKSKIAFLNNKIADLDIKITNLETKEDILNKQITKINSEIINLDTSQTNVNTRITNLETKEDGLNKQIIKINKEVKDVQTWEQSKNATNKQWFDNASINNCSWVAVATDDTKPLLNYC